MMKRPYFQCFLIVCWCISTISTFNTKRNARDDDDGPLDYQILLTTNQHKRILENLERVANRSTETPDKLNDKRKVFFLYINHQNSTYEDSNDARALDSWSVIWYVASFGGLIAFFLAVSCSEWCCRHRIGNNSNCTVGPTPQSTTTTTTGTRNSVLMDTPPPSYDQFAPPSYDSICLGRNHGGEKNEYEIYIVPVHMVGTIIEQDTPPSYSNLNQNATRQ